jgi:signal peptidase I
MSKRSIRISAIGLLLLGLAVYLANPFGSPTGGVLGRVFGQQFFRVPSRSMEPTLNSGSLVRACFSRNAPMRVDVGRIAVFQTPDELELLQIKRIAALAGETIEIVNGQVVVNGAQTLEWFRSNSDGSDYGRRMPMVRVPVGSVFVLGDNLDRSRDSRMFGPVQVANIFGYLCGN